MGLVHDGAGVLRLIRNGPDCSLEDAAPSSGHVRMLGRAEDGRRGPGEPRSARRSRRKGTALRVFRADRLTRGLVLSPTIASRRQRTEGGIWPMHWDIRFTYLDVES
jgi:hypothetical protein